ncbi:MAG: ROK family protein [Acidimicrobiia bacterium]
MTVHLGLDLGGTNIKVVAIDANDERTPEIVGTAQWPTGAEDGPRAVTQRLIDAGRAMAESVGPVSSVGVGVPGLFEQSSGTIVLFPNLPGPWPGFDVRSPMEEALGLPAALINDARAFVLAEGTLGAGTGHKTFIGITLGTGIGGGLMINGSLHVGEFGTGGEIGHQIIVPDGPLCGCGNRGCVEALAMSTTLEELADRNDAAEIYALAAQGDETCRTAVNHIANYIGIGLANVVTLIGPSCIVVGGGMSEGGEIVLNPIRESLRRHVTLAPVDQISVVRAELGSWAGAIGAALEGRAQAEVRAT